MDIYQADTDSIKNDLIKLREDLIRAKSIAEKSIGLSNIEYLNYLYFCLTQEKALKSRKIYESNRGNLHLCNSYNIKLGNLFCDNFIENRDNIAKFSNFAANKYSKEIVKNYLVNEDIIPVSVFSESDALLMLEAFFEEVHPEEVSYVHDLIKNKRLLRVDNLELYNGTCMYILNNLPFIMVENERDKYDVKTLTSLIHEIGHAVDYKKLRENYSVNVLEKYLYLSPSIEVNSRLYEKQALEFFIKEDINCEYAIETLLNYHYTNYLFLLEVYLFSLLPSELIKENYNTKYNSHNIILNLPATIDVKQFSDLLSDEDKLFNIGDSFSYAYGGVLATIIDSKIKDDRESGEGLYNKFMANRVDAYRESLFSDLGITYQDAAKCIEKELKILKK